MNKYKKIAIAAFVVGGLQGLYALMVTLSIYPKVTQVYEDFGATTPVITQFTPFILIFPALANIIIGILVLTSKNKDKYYSLAKIVLIVTLVLALLVFPLVLSFGLLLPMFNIVNVL